MIDMASTVVPKSDQLNADDLIAGPLDIVVTRVSKSETPEQPISIWFDGDGGRPYKPCKTMRRVMIAGWGADGSSYVGRAMRLYRDDAVMFGGQQVGGIRISHMSGLAKPLAIALSVTKGKRALYRVAIMSPAPAATTTPKAALGDEDERRLQAKFADTAQAIADADDVATLDAIVGGKATAGLIAWLRSNRPDMAERIDAAVDEARQRIGTVPPQDDGFPGGYR